MIAATQRWPLFFAGASCGFFLLFSPACERSRPKRPNVLLISVDSLRADHLGGYGYGQDTSPRLDGLAAEGVLFVNTIADSSWTLPTHATLFTGLPSRVHGVVLEETRLDPERRTLAELLAAAGYECRGLWSGPYLHPVFGLAQGFEAADYRGVVGELVYDDPAFESADPDEREARRRQMNLEHHSTVSSPHIADAAVEFLRSAPDRPFFLFLHFFDVHYDYIPPEADWRRFDPDYTGELSAARFAFNEAIHKGMPRREKRHLLALYDGEIYFTDRQIGRVLDALAEAQLEDETLVVFTADHGEEFFEHGGKGHRLTLYDEVLEVPLIFRWPARVAGGRRVTSQVRHLDVMPTILEAVGLPIPDEVLGTSLWPVLEGGAPLDALAAPSSLVLPGRGTLTTLRGTDWKLFVWEDAAGGEPRFSLHDRRVDPDEKHPKGPRASEVADLYPAAMAAYAAWSEREESLLRTLPRTEDLVPGAIPEEILEQLRELGYTDQ